MQFSATTLTDGSLNHLKCYQTHQYCTYYGLALYHLTKNESFESSHTASSAKWENVTHFRESVFCVYQWHGSLKTTDGFYNLCKFKSKKDRRLGRAPRKLKKCTNNLIRMLYFRSSPNIWSDVTITAFESISEDNVCLCKMHILLHHCHKS